jgi:hypothetical protein
MKAAAMRLKGELGILGMLSLLLIAMSAIFCLAVISPLEARNSQLDRELANSALKGSGNGFTRISLNGPASRLEAFYRFFERPERTDEWLAKLYGIATASGLGLRSGDYRLIESRQRFERYQLTLPLSGSYSQIRSFTEAALAEIPVLSLDQISFRRKAANDARVEAEVVLTLHLLKR